MQSLRQAIEEAERKNIAIGHFNVSDIAALKAVFEAVRDISTSRHVDVPVIIGVSEGEREFIGTKQIAILVRSLREEYDYPIFLNADHTHSFDKIKEAVEAGFDAVLFDGSKLKFEDNILKTKEVVSYVRRAAPHVLVEGEIGYIGSGSMLLHEIPTEVDLKTLTDPLEANSFVKETGVDLLAPAVGNLHGMIIGRQSPRLDIGRIASIKNEAKIPLVLHGGSGIIDEDFVAAISAGISIVHINTELRVAWKKGILEVLESDKDEVVTYKILAGGLSSVRIAAAARVKLFSGM